MARGYEPLIAISSKSRWLARSALIALAILCLTPLVALGAIASSSWQFNDAVVHLSDPVVLRALRFTLLQAGLSTLISIGLAIPVVMSLRQTRSGALAQTARLLFALPLVLPQLVAALAIVAVFGQNGWIAQFLDALKISWPSIYGLGGVLLAHVFFNMPLAVRIFDQALQSLPPEYEQNAAQLGLQGVRRFAMIEGVVIRDTIGGVATIIFLLCATSFTIVLVLGGGPRSTTLEVAIYQALAFDFDLGRALTLIVVMLFVTGSVVLLFTRRGRADLGGSGFSLSSRSTNNSAMAGPHPLRFESALILLLAITFVALPFAAILLDGLMGRFFQVWLRPSVLAAAGTSVAIGFFSASLATIGAMATAIAGPSRLTSVAPLAVLIFPPIVLSAGWFLTIRQFADPFAYAAILVVAINAAMALPFVMHIIDRACATHMMRHGALEAQLGLTGWSRWRLSLLPAVKMPLLVGFAFAFALSLGDFGVVALFGSDRLQTLPYLIYASFGSYRSQDAVALALLLGLLVLVAVSAAEIFARRDPAHSGIGR